MIVNDHIMMFSVTPQMSAVTTIVVGFLILDNFGKKFSFGSSVAKQVKN